MRIICYNYFNNMLRKLKILPVILLIFLVSCAVTQEEKPSEDIPKEVTFNDYILRTVMLMEDGGGFYAGRQEKEEFEHDAWQGLDQAVILDDGKVKIDMSKANPSFCSSAIYIALLKSLKDWDQDNRISYEAWENLKPYTVEDRKWRIQGDGEGCWGRANANGPGLAVLINELKAGTNTYLAPRYEYSSKDEYYEAWRNIEPGDILKLFWNRYIGADDEHSERGHIVIFLDMKEIIDETWKKDAIIYYWSSNGSGFMPDKGYSIGKARLSEIYRAVATHIDDPAAFDNAKNIMPDDANDWLVSLYDGHLASEEEMLKELNITK